MRSGFDGDVTSSAQRRLLAPDVKTPKRREFTAALPRAQCDHQIDIATPLPQRKHTLLWQHVTQNLWANKYDGDEAQKEFAKPFFFF